MTINPGDICVACRNGDVIIKDAFPFKIKAIDSFWSISEGKLLIHLGEYCNVIHIITYTHSQDSIPFMDGHG